MHSSHNSCNAKPIRKSRMPCRKTIQRNQTTPIRFTQQTTVITHAPHCQHKPQPNPAPFPIGFAHRGALICGATTLSYQVEVHLFVDFEVEIPPLELLVLERREQEPSDQSVAANLSREKIEKNLHNWGQPVLNVLRVSYLGLMAHAWDVEERLKFKQILQFPAQSMIIQEN